MKYPPISSPVPNSRGYYAEVVYSYTLNSGVHQYVVNVTVLAPSPALPQFKCFKSVSCMQGTLTEVNAVLAQHGFEPVAHSDTLAYPGLDTLTQSGAREYASKS